MVFDNEDFAALGFILSLFGLIWFIGECLELHISIVIALTGIILLTIINIHNWGKPR